jgi:hypothetical protein
MHTQIGFIPTPPFFNWEWYARKVGTTVAVATTPSTFWGIPGRELEYKMLRSIVPTRTYDNLQRTDWQRRPAKSNLGVFIRYLGAQKLIEVRNATTGGIEYLDPNEVVPDYDFLKKQGATKSQSVIDWGRDVISGTGEVFNNLGNAVKEASKLPGDIAGAVRILTWAAVAGLIIYGANEINKAR